jgi:hypothetical protein
MSQLMKKELLPPALDILERKQGKLTSISGQGIMKGERNTFVKDGKTKRSITKSATFPNGRISFQRDGDDWIGLDESDYVIIIGPIAADDPTIMVSMFDKKTLRDAFDANHAAQAKEGKGHLPNWIAPFHEEGRGARGVGDGFQEKAIWSEPLYSGSRVPPPAAPPPPRDRSTGLTIEQAKAALAKTFGVKPDAVEITIRG